MDLRKERYWSTDLSSTLNYWPWALVADLDASARTWLSSAVRAPDFHAEFGHWIRRCAECAIGFSSICVDDRWIHAILRLQIKISVPTWNGATKVLKDFMLADFLLNFRHAPSPFVYLRFSNFRIMSEPLPKRRLLQYEKCTYCRKAKKKVSFHITRD